MQTLPPPIRRYLGRGGYSQVAKTLMSKYNLHIDQGTILEREIMLLLMGIENPNEFTQALAEEARLDKAAIDGIVGDINEQIFMPLREEMRKGGGDTQAQKPPPPPKPKPIAPPPSYQPPPPQPRPAPPPPPPSAPLGRSDLPKSPQQPQKAWEPDDSVFIPANPQLPQRQPETYISRPSFSPPRPPVPPRPAQQSPGINRIQPPPQPRPQALEKSADSTHMLSDHEVPHIELKNSVPPNLPGAFPPTPASPPPSPKATQGTAPPPPPPPAPYTSDPYREPLE